MKKFIMIVMLCIFMVSCADSKDLCYEKGDVKKCKTFEPYGLFDMDNLKDENITYKVNVGNIVWGCLLSGTIVVPVLIVGFDLWEPISVKSPEVITVIPTNSTAPIVTPPQTVKPIKEK